MIRLARPFLLAALFLHALMPAGWMPNPAGLGESAFIICTADGMIRHGQAPSQPDSTVHHDACVFAAAAHVAAPPETIVLAAPTLRTAALAPTVPALAAPALSRFAPQAPRAPPVSA